VVDDHPGASVVENVKDAPEVAEAKTEAAEKSDDAAISDFEAVLGAKPPAVPPAAPAAGRRGPFRGGSRSLL